MQPTSRSVIQEVSPSRTFEVLTAFAEQASDDPEALEQALRRMTLGLRETLGVQALAMKGVTQLGNLSIIEGETDGRSAVEFPILRGKMCLGTISAFMDEDEHLDEVRANALRTAAAVASLAIFTLDASETVARQAAQGSVVQLASEAMGTILDENQLYRTVLVLTLELLSSSAGAVFLENDGEVSIGFEDQEERLQALRQVALSDRKPWMGHIGNGHTLGVRIGRSGGAIFLFREMKPYTVAEGVSLKLVARQLAYAQERSRLHAALEQTNIETILALSAALESRDRTTGDHIERTQLLAERVAVGLQLSPDDVQATRYTAILHDIGKIGIPDSILNKTGKLDDDEWRVMKRHCAIGANILSKVAGFKQVSKAVLAHHERFDGQGYPAGISGTKIPIEARIVAVVDAYDAMTHDRPYQKAMSHDEAIKQLDLSSGAQFFPEVVEVMKAVLAEERLVLSDD